MTNIIYTFVKDVRAASMDFNAVQIGEYQLKVDDKQTYNIRTLNKTKKGTRVTLRCPHEDEFQCSKTGTIG